VTPTRRALNEISEMASPLRSPADLDPLIERIGDSRYVLLGEASHGTSEFYRWRAEITKRLIDEHGFSFVAVEGDWPDCFDINCWVTGRTDRKLPPTEVLTRFSRWPTWMWANREVAEFVGWLRDHNRRFGTTVGFYGLDVYSLWESIDRVVDYLRFHHPDDVEPAMRAFRCFQPYGEDPQRYAYATRMVPTSCEDEVVRLLGEFHGRLESSEGDAELDLDALQNAEVVAGAERYYRAMMLADGESWNIRDCHMVDTLDRLMAHFGPDARAVVWEHNTHVGDARATDMHLAGMVNVGQVVRERHEADGVVLVGFAGYEGSVIAAPRWGETMRRMNVPPAVPASHEALIHEAVPGDALFVFPEHRDTAWLSSTRGHRAIGVVYDPSRDRYGNWVPTVLGRRYDALVSFEHTDALHPLHMEVPQPHAELETYPFET
jgi:erythromycin esterase